jgi:hypothetical protein
VPVLGQQAEQETAEARVILDDEQVHRPVIPVIPEGCLRFAKIEGSGRDPSHTL